jgi:hypothetical protein
MNDYLDLEEVECINKALKYYQNLADGKVSIREVNQLLKIFPLGQQYVFDSDKPFSNFASSLKSVLKKALNAYCHQSPPLPDLDIALRILQHLS